MDNINTSKPMPSGMSMMLKTLGFDPQQIVADMTAMSKGIQQAAMLLQELRSEIAAQSQLLENLRKEIANGRHGPEQSAGAEPEPRSANAGDGTGAEI